MIKGIFQRLSSYCIVGLTLGLFIGGIFIGVAKAQAAANDSDKIAIMELVNNWAYRDSLEWDKLLTLFHEDGHIEVTWFEGPFTEFVKGSQRMGASDFRTKHMIGIPVMKFNAAGTKCIAETSAMVVGENVKLDIGVIAHDRFYDMIEKRNGEWKIVYRTAIYDFAYNTFSMGTRELDNKVFQKYPREYAALAYVLEKSGFPVERVFATKGSQLEKDIRAKGDAWLLK